MCPHFSLPWNSKHWCHFDPVDFPGPNHKPLTTPRGWGPEAVKDHSERNVEPHHDISQAWLQLPERIPEAYPTGGHRFVWNRKPKTGLDRHPPVPSTHTITPPQKGTLYETKGGLEPYPTLEHPCVIGPDFSPRGISQDQSHFGLGDAPWMNNNPS